MKKNERTFLGNPISGDDYQIINSFLGVVAGTYGRDLKTTKQLWDGVARVFGKEPKPGESFMASVKRILKELRAIPRQTRTVLRKHYRVKPQRRVQNVERVSKPTPPKMTRATPTDPQPPICNSTPTLAMKTAFYASWEWRTMRYQVLKEEGRACSCCGARPGDVTEAGDSVRIVVDHIKPLSKYWHLRLRRPNLSVLCDSCNMGKGNWDETDWRRAS